MPQPASTTTRFIPVPSVFRAARLACTAAAALLSGLPSTAATVRAQSDNTLTTLYSFTGGDDGAFPDADIIQTQDGNFYGRTTEGQVPAVLYRLSLDGNLSVLRTFSEKRPNGRSFIDVDSGLVQGGDGSFYGTTSDGGDFDSGTIYRISPDGSYNLLHSFDGSDGNDIDRGLARGRDGNFYGTAAGGGNSSGTIYRITANGDFTLLYSFSALVNQTDTSSGTNDDGSFPQGTIVEGLDGNFYGTAAFGGANGTGTVFRVSPAGSFTLLHTFSDDSNRGNADGAYPGATLFRDTAGNFYGSTGSGGGADTGTIFRLTENGDFSTLHSFNPVNTDPVTSFGSRNADGAYPVGTLGQASDGNLYGTTAQGGPNGTGTIFRLNPSGEFTSLYSFSDDANGGNPDGAFPQAGLIQGGDGNFYGTTFNGGPSDKGTFFRFTVPSIFPPPGVSLLTVQTFDDGLHTAGYTIRRLVAPNSGKPRLKVAYAVGGTGKAGKNYQKLRGSVTLAENADSVTIPLVPFKANIKRPVSVTLTLSGGQGYQIGTPDTSTVDIFPNPKGL